MARMPFARWMKRILGEQADLDILDAVACIWGEEALRTLAQQRKAERVRVYYHMVRRQCARCGGAVGQHILIDEGEMTSCGTYGHGHVYTGGTVQSAEAVIVESANGKRGIAYEVSIVRGVTRRAGKFIHRIRGKYLVDRLPRGDRGQGRSEDSEGNTYEGRCIGDSDPRNLTARATAGSVHGGA